MRQLFVATASIDPNAPGFGPDFALGKSRKYKPSAAERIQQVLSPAPDQDPSREEEPEGSHSIAMAAAQETADRDAQDFLDSSVHVPPPPPPPPLSDEVLQRIAANRAAALEARRIRAQLEREARRVLVNVEGLFALRPEPSQPQLVQSDLHGWLKLAINTS